MTVDKIVIMSMNCRGLADAAKRRDVMHYIWNKNYSIVFLQDRHQATKSIPYFDNLWCGRAYHSCFRLALQEQAFYSIIACNAKLQQ